MGKLALRLAFFATGMNFVAVKLGDVLGAKTPMLYVLAMCLPAVILGAAAWCAVPSFARSSLVVVCVLIASVGMLYATEAENYRGVVGLSYIIMALPIAALIVENRCWWLCARVYVYANALALGLALYFEYWVHGITMVGKLHRLGFLASEDGAYRLANPNMVGGQLAFVAVLAFMIHLRKPPRRSQLRTAAAGARKFNLGWTVFLSLGCILTASRGAFLAWLGAMGLLLLYGTKSQRASKVNDLVAFSGVLLLIMAFASVAVGFTPWGSLQDRFNSGTEVVTGSGRTLIWKSAFDTWRSNTRYLLVGTGMGVAPEALGHHLGLTKGDGCTPAALDAHNAFVEWGLSFGLLGMAAGICMLVAVCRKARKLDRRDRTINRQAILLCFCLASMNYVTFYQQLFVAAGALILSSLSKPPPRAKARSRSRSESSSGDRPAERIEQSGEKGTDVLSHPSPLAPHPSPRSPRHSPLVPSASSRRGTEL